MDNVVVHEKAICETSNVGPRTRIWAFAHVLPGACIGSDCNICDGVFIENDVIIGDRATVKCGVQLWDGTRVEDDVFIGPNATFTNEKFPRSKQYAARLLLTVIRQGASIGANATVLPGLEIGRNAMVGAGAVVTRSVPANAIVRGNPAQVHGYVETLTSDSDPAECASTIVQAPGAPAGIEAVRLQELRTTGASNGDFSAIVGFEREIPFLPKRCFLIHNNRAHESRAEYAYRQCHRFIVCARGSCEIVLDDSSTHRVITLDRSNVGLYVPPMIWTNQFCPAGTSLLVFASHENDPLDCIRDRDEFLALRIVLDKGAS